MNKENTLKSVGFNTRNMFDENMILTYDMICEQGATYEEYMKALGRKENKNNIEDVVGQPPEIPPFTLKDGREIQFVLKETKIGENDKRWVIEWYEGVWTETEPKMKKKKGFVHREVFYNDMDYTYRLRELEMDDDHSPIIVGTYECKIINDNPERTSL